MAREEKVSVGDAGEEKVSVGVAGEEKVSVGVAGEEKVSVGVAAMETETESEMVLEGPENVEKVKVGDGDTQEEQRANPMSPREVEMMVKVLDQYDYDIKKERRINGEKACLDTTDTTNVTPVIKQEKIDGESQDMKEVRYKGISVNMYRQLNALVTYLYRYNNQNGACFPEYMEVKPAIIAIAPQGPKHKLISSSVQGKEIKGNRNPSDIKKKMKNLEKNFVEMCMLFGTVLPQSSSTFKV
ncbi:uncharacterized protein LOC142144242 isoform X1 [Mixophyes fleayi]|uniref:uncharacterized protein LOC142144242 isoform X1 n=1 Tax=Mixophyes fleayi TaxID=3061075 RepID=UPI003F4E0EFA